MGRLLLCFCVALGVLVSFPAHAAAHPAASPPAAQPQDPLSIPPPPPMPPPATECFPACRSGYFCSQGQCYSSCNPPCAAGDECNPSGQCVPAGRAADVPLAQPEPSGPVINPEGDGEHAPRGFHYETRRRRGMLIAGSVLLGVSYLISLAYGGLLYAVYNNDGRWLAFAVPVVGPVIGQFAISTSYGFGYNRNGAFTDWFLALAGTIAQAAGLTLGIFGFLPHQELVRDRDPRDYDSERSSKSPPMRLSFAPFAAGAPLGFTLLLEN